MSENGITIKKVKYFGRMHIEYENVHDGITDTLTMESEEEPSPNFVDSLKRLAGPTCTILEPKEDDFIERIQSYGVAYKYNSDGVMSAMIMAKLKLPETRADVALTTPMRKCDLCDGHRGTFLTPTAEKILWDVEREARGFVAGERAQTSLFMPNGEPAEVEEPPVEVDEPKAQVMDLGNEPAGPDF